MKCVKCNKKINEKIKCFDNKFTLNICKECFLEIFEKIYNDDYIEINNLERKK